MFKQKLDSLPIIRLKSSKKTSGFSILIILSVILIIQSCKSPTEPKTDSRPSDTTSQNFTWQKYYFGVNSYNLLNDIVIINDSSVWAVGSIFLNDSTGKLELAQHNAIHWDGNNWDILKIPYYYQKQPFYHPIQTVYSFSSNDIWFCGNGVLKWDGYNFNPIDISSVWGPDQVNKIWGTSSDDLYIVGNNGSIAHYTNGAWNKLVSGTDLNIKDIWGNTNPSTGKSEILAVATYYGSTNTDRKIIQINNSAGLDISTSGINWLLNSVWFKSQSVYYVAGTGIYVKNGLGDTTWNSKFWNATNYNVNCIRGNDINDVVAVGAYGEVIHFNGNRWKSFKETTGLPNGEYLSVAIKGNKIVAVGYDGQQAVIVVGQR
jgi:hypothetical protein